MPLGDDESKANLSDLFSTNSAINFNNGVVTYNIFSVKKSFEQRKEKVQFLQILDTLDEITRSDHCK